MLMVILTCTDGDVSGPGEGNTEFRDEMRSFVVSISEYGKSQSAGFIVIPQNGQELFTDSGEPDGILQTAYLSAVDAAGREDMFYGYENDNEPTPEEDTQRFADLCVLCEQNGVEVLATDYCWTHSRMDDSYYQNEQYGFISFAADHRELDNIPEYPSSPHNVNGNDITDISRAANFLYLINNGNFPARQAFITAVAATDYDVIIMDLFYNDDAFTAAEIQQLRTKASGGTRLVVCYMSIGEAEDYRYYWQPEWEVNKPSWLGPENPDWPGNYKVYFWDTEWQNIIFGNEDSYMKMIIDAGFDGVYLDIIDAFEYFEDQ